MINADYRVYNYYLYEGQDDYGQPKLSEDIKGQVKMAIYPTSQSIQANVLYHNAQYVGITQDKTVKDTFVIDYSGTKLKILYVSPTGRLQQVFLSKVG
jgi:hypothetical protein